MVQVGSVTDMIIIIIIYVSVSELLCFVDQMLQQTADTLTNFMTWRAICRAQNLTHTSGMRPTQSLFTKRNVL